jgi:hypothetical protein
VDELRDKELAKWILAGRALLTGGQYEAVIALLSPRRRGPRVSEDAVIDALRAAQGIVTAAAQRLGMHRNTLHKRIQRSAKLQAVQDEANEITVDFAESRLLQHVRDGNIAANIFLLKCKGKKRGWVESYTIDPPKEGKVEITIEEDKD